MIFLGQANRYMGETCWTWGGGDFCNPLPPQYSGGSAQGHGGSSRYRNIQRNNLARLREEEEIMTIITAFLNTRH
jgi:hypothetical protein